MLLESSGEFSLPKDADAGLAKVSVGHYFSPLCKPAWRNWQTR